MTQERISRTKALIGEDGVRRLARASVAVFGVGGVGSYAAEALARAGIGHLTFIDGDCVEESNINRQLVADYATLGLPKAEVMRERALRANPDCKAIGIRLFYSEETSGSIDLSAFDYILDAIDTVKSKLLLIENAIKAGVPIISCMGAGNKLDPSRFEAADISATSVCPLARVMRQELRKRGIEHLKVVYSREEPVIHARIPASISFVPAAAGLMLAAETVKDLLKAQD